MNWIIELGGLVLKAIIPPPEADPRAHYLYRLRVTLVACAAFCLVCFAYPAALGRFPWLFSGFATKTDFVALKGEVDVVVEDSIEDSIRAKLRIRCNTQDQAFKSELSDEVNRMEKRYYTLTQNGYRQPTCEELE